MFNLLPWRMVGGGLVALAFLSLLAHDRIVTRQNGKLKEQIVACSQAREGERAAYVAAQEEAARRNKAEVERIEADQRRVTHEVESDLTARLERLRRELRAQAAPGSASGAGAAQAPTAGAGPDEAPRVCLAPDELLRAAENEERHDRLIDWVERQTR